MDAEGQPVAGASIQVAGARRGTITAADGMFALTAPASASSLHISALNYQSVDIAIGDRLRIVLQRQDNTLEEVLVVAYGTQKPREMTSSVSVLPGDEIGKQQIVTLGQALQGTVAGVEVVNGNGQPGENPDIRIRGVASINASAAPLLVVDGIVFDGNLNMLNPADVQSVSVLKDALAAALYGSRAANGVILITTRRGTRNAPPTVSVRGSYGFSSQAVRDYPYLNTQQQFELTWETARNYFSKYFPDPADSASKAIVSYFGYNPYGVARPVDATGHLQPGLKPLWNDDWTKSLHREAAARRECGISIGGGSERSRYFISAGYLDQQGTLVRSDYRRLSVLANYTTDVTDWLQIGLKTSLATSRQNYPEQGTYSYNDAITFERAVSSVFPIYQHDTAGNIVRDLQGNPLYDFGKGAGLNSGRGVLPGVNLVATEQLDDWYYDRFLTDINSFTSIKLASGLNFKSSFGFNRSTVDQLNFQNPLGGVAAAVNGRIAREHDLTSSFTWNNMLSFDRRWSQQHLQAMVSYEAYRLRFETESGSKTGLGVATGEELTNASTVEDLEGFSMESALVSYLGRIQYDYAGKYFAEFTGRRDASSVFAPGRRAGFFPAGGIGWLVSNESFLKSARAIDLLKLRASFGATGNNAILNADGSYNYFPYSDNFQAGANNGTQGGVYLQQAGNPAIGWERQLIANIGVDFGLFDRRLSGSVDWFRKESRDLIMDQPLAPSLGFSSLIGNAGKIRNSGIEVALTYTLVRTARIRWEVNANAAFLRNRVVALLPGIDTFASQGVFRNVVGKPLYSFYLPVWAGVDPATGQGAWRVKSNQGDTLTQDYNNTATANKAWVGSGLPKITGGFGTRVDFGALDLSLLFNFALGGKYYDLNYQGLMQTASMGSGHQLDADVEKRWQKPGDKTDVPVLDYNSYVARNSTRFLYSGDYLRLRNITVGYRFRTNAWQKYIRGARVTLRGDNLLTFDRLPKGSDPESSLNGLASAHAFVAKTISAGIELDF